MVFSLLIRGTILHDVQGAHIEKRFYGARQPMAPILDIVGIRKWVDRLAVQGPVISELSADLMEYLCIYDLMLHRIVPISMRFTYKNAFPIPFFWGGENPVAHMTLSEVVWGACKGSEFKHSFAIVQAISTRWTRWIGIHAFRDFCQAMKEITNYMLGAAFANSGVTAIKFLVRPCHG